MSYMSERSPSAQWPSGHPLDPRGSSTVVYRGGKTTDSDLYQVGVYGWRKRCLYAMIILLSVVIVVNVALTAWIMRVLDFSVDGMGGLEMSTEGMRVKGRAEFDQPVHFRSLETPPGVPLSIESARGVSVQARNKSGVVVSKLVLGEDGTVAAECDRFEVRNAAGQLLFATDKDEVAVKVENLRIIGEGGSVFEGAVQTEVIRPEPESGLRLESPTRGLEVEAAQDIELLSRAGDIAATALLDVSIESAKGGLELNSRNMYISGLRVSVNTGRPQFQLCLCESGRLFRANSGADCRADANICN